MDKELCFIIEGKKLYMEQILVEYEGMPIFFLCSDGECYYLVLCRDIEAESYIIVMPDIKNISSMLHGRLTMRDIITNEKHYWDVATGEDMDSDVVEKRTMDQIPLQDLPYEDSFFKSETKELELFVEKIDNELFGGTGWETVPVDLWKNIEESFCLETEYMVDEICNVTFQRERSLSGRHLSGDFLDFFDNEAEMDRSYVISFDDDKREQGNISIILENNFVIAA